jgi:hypothetical protein
MTQPPILLHALPAPRQLPVIAAFTHMVNSIRHNWRVGARHGLPWVALLTLFKAWSLWSPEVATPGAEPPVSWQDILALGVGIVATSSIALSWHRYILLDEPPASVPPFRMDRLVWRYMGRSCFIGAVGIAPLVGIALLSELMPAALVPVWLALGMAIVVILIRLSISLVGTALGRTDFGLKAALIASRGNMMRILGLIGLTGLVEIILLITVALPMAAVQPDPPAWALPATILLSIPVQLVAVLFNVTLLTTLYGFFVERRDF